MYTPVRLSGEFLTNYVAHMCGLKLANPVVYDSALLNVLSARNL